MRIPQITRLRHHLLSDLRLHRHRIEPLMQGLGKKEYCQCSQDRIGKYIGYPGKGIVDAGGNAGILITYGIHHRCRQRGHGKRHAQP